MTPAVPQSAAQSPAFTWPVLQAPSHWRHVDFISDLHLQASEVATVHAWQHYMQSTRADAVFILGDLFEVWVGDDVIDAEVDNSVADPDQAQGFEARCAQVLQAASQRLDIFFMHGNRDFLLGPTFAKACGMTLLDDPTVLNFAEQRWLLSHGDALCRSDTDYMQFRSQVRSVPWQRDFLGKPLAQRQEIARALRTQSETRKRSGVTYADVDIEATCDWLRTAQGSILIHGHTHKPADHDLAKGLRRIVLSDWDASATPPRAEVLRLSVAHPGQATGSTIQRLPAAIAS
jgi:UDP-2,3-diacylglucosamine hydrolase